MKKRYLALIAAAMVAGCSYVESSDTYSSEAIRRAELGQTENTYFREPRAVSLPEEISAAEPGDTLTVYAVTKDSIFIGFANSKNK